MISQDTISSIFDAAIIEDIIGEFVHLKKSGSSYKGLSPWSNEKTPSFFVIPSKGIYKDFSSGKGGNVVSFLMEHEKMSYPEALRWLAAKYNIEIDEDKPTEEQMQERSERENLSLVSDFAHRYFQQQLHETEDGRAIGLSYFIERGFRDDIITKFQLGYCPDNWDAMTQAALEAGYNLKYLEKTGLTRLRDGVPYDFFRGRVMFPIHNVSGKIIAFAGRTLKAEKDIAKYFNSPESELYNKSNVLFGLHLAKNSIVKNNNCFLVEGYTDVISLHQAGIENVVASSGTSLTEGQIRQIRRYTLNVTILYDGDSAGIKASFRGIDMILKEGLNVRVVLFPDGDDPDSFAKKHSSAEIQEFIDQYAKDFIRFKTSLLIEEAGNDPVKRAALIRGIVDSIALIPDGIQRSVYVQECSHLLNMQENVLIAELNKSLAAGLKKMTREELPLLDEIPADGIPVAEPESGGSFYHQEKDFIRILLSYGEKNIDIPVQIEEGKTELHAISVAEYLIGSLEQDDLELQDPIYSRILKEYVEFVGREEIPETKKFTLHSDEGIATETSNILANRYHLSDNWTVKHGVYPEIEEMLLRKASKDCVFRLKLRKVLQLLSEIDNAMKNEAEEEKIEALLHEKIILNKAKMELSKYFGSAVLY
ncbi:MAG: DNA primase [Crocinitomicaceae bacterium]|nr:DNA primase [Crocinitomicaceae bacterium]